MANEIFAFTKAERKKAKLKLNLSGPSGSGKTYSAEVVENHNGVDMAKRFIDANIECNDSDRLKQAIADVESCMERL